MFGQKAAFVLKQILALFDMLLTPLPGFITQTSEEFPFDLSK